MDGMRRLQVCPALRQLASNNPPDDDPCELDLLSGFAVRCAPGVADDDFIPFGDNILDRHVNIGKALESGGKVLLGTFWSRRQTWWNIGAVLLVIGRKIPIRGPEVLPVDEILKMASNEVLGCFRTHDAWILGRVALSCPLGSDLIRLISGNGAQKPAFIAIALFSSKTRPANSPTPRCCG